MITIQPLYTAVATSTGGRAGHTRSETGKVDLPLSVPKEMGGDSGPGTNPEELFAAGYSACFEGALRLVARTQKIQVKDASITARVSFGKDEGGGFGLAVELHGRLPELSREQAEKLMADAHQVCPYSRATRGNIDVKLIVD